MANQIVIADGILTEDHSKPKRFTRYASTAARLLMGLLFGLTGVMGLLQVQRVDGLPPGAADLIFAFANARYFIPLLSATQAVAAALLLSNRFVPLALTVLAPVIVNIVAFHAFLAPQGIPIAVVVLATEIYLAVVNRKAFRSLLVSRS